jgi:hypothetical protein
MTYKMRGMGGLLTMYGGAGEELEAFYNNKKQAFLKAKNDYLNEMDPVKKQQLRDFMEKNKVELEAAKNKMSALLNGVSDAALRAAQNLQSSLGNASHLLKDKYNMYKTMSGGAFDFSKLSNLSNQFGSVVNSAINSDLGKSLVNSGLLEKGLSSIDSSGKLTKQFSDAKSSGLISSLGTKEGSIALMNKGLSESGLDSHLSSALSSDLGKSVMSSGLIDSALSSVDSSGSASDMFKSVTSSSSN